MVPEDDGRAVKQAREQDALDPEMAEEKNIFCIRAERGVEMVAALVAVLRDQEVKLLDDAAVDRVNAEFL